MPTVKKSIEVDVPVRTTYDQWTQFEEFPRFMEGVEAVQQLDDERLHWRAKVAGKVEEWDATITEQVADNMMPGVARRARATRASCALSRSARTRPRSS